MRLLILATEFPPGPGGIGTHAYEVARGLAARGWQVTVIAPQDYASEGEIGQFNAAQMGLTIIRARRVFSGPGKALHRWLLARRALREPPDLVMATGERAAWVAAALPRRTPLVVIGHGSEFGLPSAWERWLTRWVFRRADHVVCVSDYTRRIMAERGFRPRSASVIPNGADETRFAPAGADEVARFREQYGFVGARLLLTIGHVSERKGQRVVIRALPKILARYPNTHYIAAGLPTQRDECTALAAQLGVTANVHFWGRVDGDTLPKLMSACDLSVMVSVHTGRGDVEGYGIAAVEAALCGKPSVVSGGSGLSEAIINGQTGLVVPQNDPEATADAILRLLADPQLRRQMGARARERALREQTWQARVACYDELFRDLAAR